MTKVESTGSTQTAPLVAMDFVYCGRRLLSDGKLAVCIAPVLDGKLLERRLFLFDRKSHRAVGGVYTGAKFSDDQVSGLTSNLLYVRRWENSAELIDWQSRDELAESTIRSKKLEADAKKVSEIEKIMLPLRTQYENYRVKRDRAGMEALRKAVIAALGCSPRTSEL